MGENRSPPVLAVDSIKRFQQGGHTGYSPLRHSAGFSPDFPQCFILTTTARTLR